MVSTVSQSQPSVNTDLGSRVFNVALFASVNEGVALQKTVVPDRPQYRGILDAFVTIHRKEGVRGLYRGVTPNVWGAGASWGLYFLL